MYQSRFECFGEVGGIKYRVTVYGRGAAIAVDREGCYGSGFWAQDSEAGEHVDHLDEHGVESLVRYLISAGVEFPQGEEAGCAIPSV